MLLSAVHAHVDSRSRESSLQPVAQSSAASADSCDCTWARRSANACEQTADDGSTCWKLCCSPIATIQSLQHRLSSPKAQERAAKRAAKRSARHRSQQGAEADISKLQFIHIPKTGGTAMEVTGRSHGLQWGKHRSKMPGGMCPFGCEGTWQPCSAWHIPPAVFAEHGKNPYAGFTTFCNVRHPYSRAISEYIFLGGACNAQDLNAGLQDILGKINASVIAIQDSFPHMPADALWLASRTQLAGARPMANLSDCHWLPQNLYAKSCDVVLHIESLREDFEAMMRPYGNAIPNVELQRHRCPPSMPCKSFVDPCELPVGSLDSVSRAMLRRVYRHDFHQFGYDPQVLPSRTEVRWRELTVPQHVPHIDSAADVSEGTLIRLFGDDLVSGSGMFGD
eukprot:scaffold128006_cov69-Phaeocystis_antarctica.AAC.6